jgi:WD40 repeat protein
VVASGSTDKTIRFWDAQTHEQLAVIRVGSMVYGLGFSPDPGAPGRLAAGCADSTIRLIDVATRQEVANLRGHTDYVHSVAWSPDGTGLVSGSGDFTVRVWDALSPAVRAQQPDALHPPPLARRRLATAAWFRCWPSTATDSPSRSIVLYSGSPDAQDDPGRDARRTGRTVNDVDLGIGTV